MIMLKSLEYLCLWICNVVNANVIDWICTRSKLYDNLNRTNNKRNKKDKQRHTKTRNKPTLHYDDEITIKNKIDVKITYFNKREREKQVRWVILGQKLTLNHPFLMDEKNETIF